MKINWFKAVAAVFLLSALYNCKGQQKELPKEEKPQQKTATSTYQPNIFNQSPGGIPNEDFAELFYPGQVAHWVRAIAEDKQGHLWLGTNHYGVMRHNGDTLEYFSENEGVGNDRINKIIADDNGVVWIATSGGLTKYENNTFTNYTTAEGLPDNSVFSVYLDKRGRLWLGTGKGVSYMEDGAFHSFEVPKPKVAKPTPSLSHDGVGDIFEDSKGQFWFAFDGQGITIYDGTDFRYLTTENGLQDNNAGGFYEDKQGGIWIASMNGGMSRYNGETFTHFTKSGIVDGVETSAIYEDSKGDLWFAAEHQGVYRYDGESFELLNEEDGLISQGIISFYEDSKGRFWLGGWKGLLRYDRGAHERGEKSFTAVTQQDGPWD